MPRQVASPASALRELISNGALPSGGSLEGRRASYEWYERDLRFRLLFAKPSSAPPKHFERSLFVSPSGQLGDPKEEGGVGATLSVIDSDRAARPIADLEGLASYVAAAREFVRDRADLCWLLCQEDGVVRGKLRAWLYQGYAARLVKALALARALDDADRARQILTELHSGRRVPVSPVADEDILQVARRRASEIKKASGISIELEA